jgi:integrase/recombinase XerC
LLKVCQSKTPRDLRDKALILCLLDSGLRASEITALRVGSVDMRTGLVTVHGKGGKQRQVRFGAKTRQAILRYLASRETPTPDSPLWVRITGTEENGGHSATEGWG